MTYFSALIILLCVYSTIRMMKNKNQREDFWQVSLFKENSNVQSIKKQLNITIRQRSDFCLYSNLDWLTSPSTPTSPIPKIVHMTFKSTSVPEKYFELLKKCQQLNPDHHFIFWTDESGRAFLKDKYPKHHNDLIKLFKDNLEFSDALRYFILHHFGGIYLDMDVECIKPFASNLKAYACVLDKESELQTQILHRIPYSVMNSVMACQRKHPFFEYVFNHLKEAMQKNSESLFLSE